MRINNFSVTVIGGRESDSSGYVEIEHGRKYALRLGNQRNVRCDAKVEIDGKEVGVFRIGSQSSVQIERPVNDNGHFTAYLSHSAEGAKSGIRVGDDTTGLIRVTFMPEVQPPWRPPVFRAMYDPNPVVGSSYNYSGTAAADMYEAPAAAGPTLRSTSREMGTGLSGVSGQSFYEVPNLDYDLSQQTTISLRLVAPRPRTDEPRPLVAAGNPVPPPVR